jgi:hypothetical protein
MSGRSRYSSRPASLDILDVSSELGVSAGLLGITQVLKHLLVRDMRDIASTSYLLLFPLIIGGPEEELELLWDIYYIIILMNIERMLFKI